MHKKGLLLTNVVLLGLGAVFSKLTSFWMMPLYTAYLLPADYGTADILINTAVLLLPFVSLSAPEAVFRFVAGGEEESEVLAVGRRLLTFGFSILVAVMPLLALFEVLRPFLLYLFCYVAFSVLHGYFAHLLRARGEYGLYAIQQVFCAAATVALAFLFLPALRLGVRGYLMAVFLADALTALILFGYLFHRRQGARRRPSRALLRSVLRYAVPLIPTATLWWVLAVSDHYVLLLFHGKALTGLYAAAGKLPALLTFASSVFLEAWHFAAIRESEESRAVLFERIYGALLPVLVLFVAGLILFSPFLVSLLFSAEFEETARYVPLLSVAATFSALSSFLGSVYVVKLRSGASLLTAFIGAVVNVALDLAWIPRRGALGAMMATLVSYIVVFAWRAAHCKRVMPFDQRLEKLAFSAVFLLLCALLVTDGYFPPAICIGGLAILPFWREIDDSVRFLVAYGKKILRISTKKTHRY